MLYVTSNFIFFKSIALCLNIFCVIFQIFFSFANENPQILAYGPWSWYQDESKTDN
jgi:hypothetical protein